MNVYDFDKTIFNGDSTINFYIFCLKRHPEIVSVLPKQIVAAFEYKIGIISKTVFKERFFCFFSKIQNIDNDVTKFWDEQEIKVKEWYYRCQDADDVIISASPEFLLEEICSRIGVKYLLASQVDKKTGLYNGENCYGEEKVRRFKECFPEKVINKFYSDSYSDQPLANIAKQAYIVKNEKIDIWR